MSRPLTIIEQLGRNAERQQAAYAELANALASGSQSRRDRVQAKIAELAAEYQRLAENLKFNELEAREVGAVRARKASKPLRELTLDALEDLGVPSPPALIADLIGAVTNVRPSPSRFASLKRDEEQAAKRNPVARPAWVVPAINAAQLTAIPRMLTSSAWSIERRIIGSLSLRTDHLRIAVNLAARLAQLREAGAPEARAMERLAYPIARSIPGAVDLGQPLDSDRVQASALRELQILIDADLAERQAAAAKIRDAGGAVRFWGRPVLLHSDQAERAIR